MQPEANIVAVRIFELVCLSLWIYGIVWVRRSRNPVYAGVYTGSTLLIGFDWIFNSNWFFRVEFSDKFIDAFRIQGVSEPLAMALNYAFYFGLPVLLLVHHRDKLDRRFGGRGTSSSSSAPAPSSPASRSRPSAGCTCGPTTRSRASSSAA